MSKKLKTMVREFETNIFLRSNEKDNFPVWCHLRYGRSCNDKDKLLLDFEEWLDLNLQYFQPIKRLYWRCYPKIDCDVRGCWRITARVALLRQLGKSVKQDIRYPSQSFECGELPMPPWGKNR